MQRNASTKLGAIAVACLAAIGLSSCCGKSAVKPEIELCPKMTEEQLLVLRDGSGPVIDYVADEIIPYCAGIKAMGE